MKKTLALAITLLLLLTSVPAFAMDNKDAAIIGDVTVVRPLGIASIVLGAAFFVVSLPFAAISGSVDDAARELVVKPVRFTFTRPVGVFPREISYRTRQDDNYEAPR